MCVWCSQLKLRSRRERDTDSAEVEVEVEIEIEIESNAIGFMAYITLRQAKRKREQLVQTNQDPLS